MSVQILKLMALFTFISIVSCSGQKGTSTGSESGSGAGGQAHGKAGCSSALQVCVGDSIRIQRQHDFEIRIISEVVPAGQLTSGEKLRVRDGGPEVGKQWEIEFREASRKTGLRLVMQGPNPYFPDAFWGEAFQTMFRFKGCTANKSYCIGYKQTSWMEPTPQKYYYGEVVKQQVMGIALAADAPLPLLVFNMSELGTVEVTPSPLGEKLAEEGCVNLPFANQPFCVGETYYYDRITSNTTYESLTKAKISYVTADITKPAIIFQIPNSQSKIVRTEIESYFTLYATKGCLPGSTSLCLPDLAGVPLNQVRYEYNLAAVHLVGFRIAGTNDDLPPVLIEYESKNVEHFRNEEVLDYTIAQGCSPDGKVCVGERYNFFQTTEINIGHTVYATCIGINRDKGIALLREEIYAEPKYAFHYVKLSDLKSGW
jgi:hypothetical protein